MDDRLHFIQMLENSRPSDKVYSLCCSVHRVLGLTFRSTDIVRRYRARGQEEQDPGG
jgi:hypothetical protein